MKIRFTAVALTLIVCALFGLLGASAMTMDQYMVDLQRRIKKNWFPPKVSESKKIVVMFKVHRMGELSDLKLITSSGISIADRAALKAVENAAPFLPLPEGSKEAEDIQFRFDYSAFGVIGTTPSSTAAAPSGPDPNTLVNSWVRVVASKPTPENSLQLAKAYAYAGDKQKAIATCQKILKASPNFKPALEQLSVLQAK